MKTNIKISILAIGAVASLWLGAWLCGHVYSFRDWQHFPAFATSAVLFLACMVGAIYSFLSAPTSDEAQKGQA